MKGIAEIHLSPDIFTQKKVPVSHSQQKKKKIHKIAQAGDSGSFLSDSAFKKLGIMPHCLAEVAPSFNTTIQRALKWISRWC